MELVQNHYLIFLNKIINKFNYNNLIMNIKLKKITMIGTWKYNMGENSNEECIICQSEFEIPCSKCLIPKDCKPCKLIRVRWMRTLFP